MSVTLNRIKVGRKLTALLKPLNMEHIFKIDELLDHDKKVHMAAKMYAENGWPIAPIRKNSKEPVGKYPHPSKHATTDLKEINKWFDPVNGVYPGHNIAIATGAGLLAAVDVDPKNNGDESFANLEEHHGDFPAGPVSNTPSGGKHYWAQWAKGFNSANNNLGPGIDTKGGTDVDSTGYCVEWPSIINDKPYKWLAGGALPILPCWSIPSVKVVPIRGGRGNENVNDQDTESLIPLSQVERMLELINPDDLDYDNWLKVGQAIHSQHQDEGLDVWDAWSQCGTRYVLNECTKRWNGFDAAGSVRMGTLIYLAKQSGYEFTKEDYQEGSLNHALHEMNEKYAFVEFRNGTGYVHYNAETGEWRVHNKHHIHNKFENKRYIDGNGKLVNLFQLWNKWESRNEVDGMGMYPPPSNCPNYYMNMWKGFPMKPEKGDIQPFFDFVQTVICNNDEPAFKWVMQWLAHLLQQPGTKPGTALVMRGGEGTGKGTFGKIIKKLVPLGTYRELIDTDTFTNKFNSFMLNNLVLVANEAVWSGNHKASNKLKGIITEKDIFVELKGVDGFDAVNFSRVMIMTNNSWAVPASSDSRRYCVLEVSPCKKQNMEFWSYINGWINDKSNIQAIMHHLLQVEVDEKQVMQAPETEALREQRRITSSKEMSEADEVVIKMLKEGIAEKAPNGSDYAGKWIWSNSMFHLTLSEIYPSKAYSSQFPSKIKSLLKSCGVKLISTQMRISGNTHRVMILPDEPIEISKSVVAKFSTTLDELEMAEVWEEPPEDF